MGFRLSRSALGCVGAVIWLASLPTTALTQGPAVPRGYTPQPPESNLRVQKPVVNGTGFTATVTNDDARQVVGLTFVALVEALDTNRPIQVLTSPEWTLLLGPHQSVALTDNWINSAKFDALRAAPRERIQLFLTPSRIRYSDGAEWALEIDRTATRSLRAIRKTFKFPPDM